MAVCRFMRACVALALGLGVVTSGNAAPGDNRTLRLHNVNTGEDLAITYKVGGVYDQAALTKLNWFFRDWRKKSAIRMDPKVFDLLETVYAATGSHETIVVHCGYRSPETNEFLRMSTPGVARESQHILGKAIDFHIPGVPLNTLRAIALRYEGGGVGFYPRANMPFVHLDVGDVRYWPPASRQYLAGLFPDGKTVLLPSDGKPLPRYDEAMAELRQRRDGVLADDYARTRAAMAAAARPGGDAPLLASVPVPVSRPATARQAGTPENASVGPVYVAAYGEERTADVFEDPFAVIMASRAQVNAMNPALRRQAEKPTVFKTVELAKTGRVAGD